MAINVSVVAKALVIASEPENRNKIITIILIPVTTIFMIIFLIAYIITNPVEAFLDYDISADELAVIEEIQINYGYVQNTYYGDGDVQGGAYTEVIFSDGAIDVTYFNQAVGYWANELYGTSSTIKAAGCGPTAMAIVISTFTGETHDPYELATWSYNNGHRCEGNGSYHTLIPAASEAYGLTCEGISGDNPQDIVDALTSGKLVVAIMSKGHFTNNGHFIVLRGVTSDGKILVADPGSTTRSGQEWDLDIIIDERNINAGAGGPFWAIGY